MSIEQRININSNNVAPWEYSISIKTSDQIAAHTYKHTHIACDYLQVEASNFKVKQSLPES